MSGVFLLFSVARGENERERLSKDAFRLTGEKSFALATTTDFLIEA